MVLSSITAQASACDRVLVPSFSKRIRELSTPLIISSFLISAGVLPASAGSPGMTTTTGTSGKESAARAVYQLRIRLDSLGIPLPPSMIITSGVQTSSSPLVPSQCNPQ